MAESKAPSQEKRMPRVNLTAGAYREGDRGERFPTLKLETNDVARLWIPDQTFAMREPAHTLKAPVFTEDGTVVLTTKEGRGGTRQVPKTDYKGRRLCTGREDVLKAKMMDPDECVICSLVKRLADAEIGEAIDLRAMTRFALPAVRYNCKTTQVTQPLRVPYSGDVLILAMSQWTWNKVDALREQMGELLGLEPGFDPARVTLDQTDVGIHCESGQWQKFDRFWPMKCAFRYDSEQARQVEAAIKGLWDAEENRPTDADLLAACGKLPDDWLARDLEDVEWLWRKASGLIAGGGADPTGGGAFGGANLADGLNDLEADLFGDPAADPLAGHPGGTAEFAPADRRTEVAAAESTATPAPATAPPADDGLFGEDPPAAAQTAAAEPAREPVTAGAAASNGGKPPAQSFANILAGLDED
jgi:hypothetical protein